MSRQRRLGRFGCVGNAQYGWAQHQWSRTEKFLERASSVVNFFARLVLLLEKANDCNLSATLNANQDIRPKLSGCLTDAIWVLTWWSCSK